jgi:hypothetical protein
MATLTGIPLGNAGALLRVGASFEQLSAPPVDVVGTIGAGDAFRDSPLLCSLNRSRSSAPCTSTCSKHERSHRVRSSRHALPSVEQARSHRETTS